MKEHKFRAWVVDEYNDDGNTPKTMKLIEWNSHFFSDTSPVTNYSGEFPEPDDPCIILEEYIGRKDRKRTEEYPEGQEIYDGDIVKYYWLAPIDHEGKKYTFLRVEYSPELMNYVLTEYGEDKCFSFNLIYNTENYEIVGNINQNLELLQ